MDYSILKNQNQDFEMMFNRLMYQKHTITVGIIDSFDPKTQTCSIMPGIKMRYQKSDGEFAFMTLPKLTNVPFLFPNSGAMSITMPIVVGSTCTILISDRSIDSFKATGEISQPEAGYASRSHHLTDAMATFGLFPSLKPLKYYTENAISIRADDGDGEKSVYIDAGAKKIDIGAGKTTILIQDNVLKVLCGNVVLDIDGEAGTVKVASKVVEFTAEDNLKLSGNNIDIAANQNLSITSGISGGLVGEGVVGAIILGEHGVAIGKTTREIVEGVGLTSDALLNKCIMGDGIKFTSSSSTNPEEADSIYFDITSDSATLGGAAGAGGAATYPTLLLNRQTAGITSASAGGIIEGTPSINLSVDKITLNGDMELQKAVTNITSQAIELTSTTFDVTADSSKFDMILFKVTGEIYGADLFLPYKLGLPHSTLTHDHGYHAPLDPLVFLPLMTKKPYHEESLP